MVMRQSAKSARRRGSPGLITLLVCAAIWSGAPSALAAVATLSNGIGEGAVSVTVDAYGTFGGASAGDDAFYDPVGPVPAAGTVFWSSVFFGPLGEFLTSEGSLPDIDFVAVTSTSTTSRFVVAGFPITLTQSLTPRGGQGTTLRQEYAITNPGPGVVEIGLVRHLDGDLGFDGTIDDAGGVSVDGRTIFEFDSGDDPRQPTTFVGISNAGGSLVAYAVQPFPYGGDIEAAGAIPAAHRDAVFLDTDGDRLVDEPYDVTLSLESRLTIPPGASATFTTFTLFGAATPSEAVNCTDAVDNDDDGLIDCADPDCAQTPVCECATAFHLTATNVERTTMTADLVTQVAERTLLTAAGDLGGTIEFTDYTLVTLGSGPFARQGLVSATWHATLEGASYRGSWQGLAALRADGTIEVQGVASGDLRARTDGSLRPSVGGYALTEVWSLASIAEQRVPAAFTLTGVVALATVSSHPDAPIDVRQLAMEGSASGEYAGGVRAVVTAVRLADPALPVHGQGLASVSYTAASGGGSARLGTVSGSPSALVGVGDGPLGALWRAEIRTDAEPARLDGSTDCTAAGLPPLPQIAVDIFGPRRVSPGEEVTYLLEYVNDGVRAAEHVVVVAALDPTAELVSASTGGRHSAASRTVSWIVDQIPAKGSGSKTVRVRLPFGLPQGLPIVVAAYGAPVGPAGAAPALAPRAAGGACSGVFFNGIGYSSDDDGMTRKYEHFAQSREAKWEPVYQDSASLLIDAVNALAASGLPIGGPIPTSVNGLDRRIAGPCGHCVGYSGGTRTLVSQILFNGLRCQTVELVSPVLISEDDLRALVDPARGGAEQVTVRVSSADDLVSLGLVTTVRVSRYADGGFMTEFYYGPVPIDPSLVPMAVTDALEGMIVEVERLFGRLESATVELQSGPDHFSLHLEDGTSLNFYSQGDPATGAPLTSPDPSRITFDVVPGMSHTAWIWCLDMDDEVRAGRLRPGRCREAWESEVATAHDPNAKAVQPEARAVPGQTLSYTVDYENEGGGIAFGVFVTDQLSPLVDETRLRIDDGGTFDPSTRTITWLIGQVGPGQSGAVHLTVPVTASAPLGREIVNFATVHFPSVPEDTRTNPVVTLVGHCAADAECSDGSVCNGTERCAGGACVPGTPPPCDDGNPCTDDTCEPAGGCTHQPNTARCSDGDACNGLELCSAGSCQGGTALECYDHDRCTVDGCDATEGCVHTGLPGVASVRCAIEMVEDLLRTAPPGAVRDQVRRTLGKLTARVLRQLDRAATAEGAKRPRLLRAVGKRFSVILRQIYGARDRGRLAPELADGLQGQVGRARGAVDGLLTLPLRGSRKFREAREFGRPAASLSRRMTLQVEKPLR